MSTTANRGKVLRQSRAVCIWAFALFIAIACSRADINKGWRFKVEGGSVRVQLGGTPEAPSQEIIYEDQAHPSLAEEASFIRDVLKELPSAGVDPSNLRGINMRGFAEPDVAQRVAIASIRFKEWKSRTTVPGGAERAVKDLLDSIGAYDPLNTVFRAYGLRVQVVGVEKVSSSKCSELHLRGIECSVHQNPRLPTGGNIFLSLVKIPR